MKKSLLVIMALALIVCFAVSAIGITKTEMPSKPKPGAAKKAPAKKKTVNTKAKKPAPAAKSDTKPVNRKRSTISKAEKGDVVTYGRYEQDGNFANGKEPIEWIVIGEDYDDDIGSYLTLISRYGLDARPYTDYNADITWENCSLRQWLNGKFLETAFIFAERGFMLTNNHNNAANSKYGTSGGGDTQDAVMLLPADYASGLFYSDASRSCTATKYAIGQGAEVNEKGLCWCWLSTPGESQDTAAVIDRNGAVNLAGLKVGRTNVAVRPVIYIERTDIDETLQAVEEYARQQGMTLEEFYAQQAAAAAAANSKKEDAAAAVPKVAGMGEAEAVSALEKAGFAVEKSDPAYSDEHPEGTVILQSPEAGSELKSGETVTIQVSLGKEFVVMPDVKGKSISDAEQMLAEAGLGLNAVSSQYSDTDPADTVISSAPEASASVSRAKGVDLVLSLGPEPESNLFIYAGVPDNGNKNEYMTGYITNAGTSFDSRFFVILSTQFGLNIIKTDRLSEKYAGYTAEHFADLDEVSLARLAKNEQARFVIIPRITTNRLINSDYMELEVSLKLFDKKSQRFVCGKTGFKSNYGDSNPTFDQAFGKFVEKAAQDFKELLDGAARFSATRTSLAEDSLTVECDCSESLRPGDKGTVYYKKSGELRRLAEVSVTSVKKDSVSLKVENRFDENTAKETQTLYFEFQIGEPWANDK